MGKASRRKVNERAQRAVAEQGAQRRRIEAEDPLAVIRRQAEVEQQAKAALLAAVHRARSDGVSWSRIGAVLGVSKQAAHERFSR